jgi:hypothetical protein
MLQTAVNTKKDIRKISLPELKAYFEAVGEKAF